MRKMNLNKSEQNGVFRKATFDKFIEFKAFPEIFREKQFGFKTENEFGKRFKVSKDTMWRWKKMNEYDKEIQSFYKKWGRDRTPDVIASLLRTCLKEGQAAEVKLWFQIIEEWEPGMIVRTPEMLSAIKERTQLLRALVAQEKTKTKKL